MNNIDQLKQLKGLLDNGVITQEEFDEEKKKLLAADSDTSSVVGSASNNGGAVSVRKGGNKTVLKRVLIIIIAVIVLAGGAVLALKIIGGIRDSKQQAGRAAALEQEIKPIMSKYGLNIYKVEYYDYSYDVFAEGFENLTKGEALDCLTELDGVEVEDPYGEHDIDFGFMTNVHPGIDVEYSYWRVSTFIYNWGKSENPSTYGYESPGLYCNQYGNECILACDN